MNDNSWKVAVVGVGALGRRHLESILGSSLPLEVYCIDVNPNAFDGLEVSDSFSNKKLFCGADISILPSHLDFVLFATSSSVRREMFDRVVEHSSVRYVLFEKVLFQREDDYSHVASRLTDLGITAWVNCGRREQICYQDLKNRLSQTDRFEVHITGGEWGLACNCIHMIDMIQFLDGAMSMNLQELKLLDLVVDSKRRGYKEVFGSVLGVCGRCSHFSISCYPKSKLPLQIDITTADERMKIEEAIGSMTIWNGGNGFHPEVYPFKLLYQSQMTHLVLERILQHGECMLPNYSESMRLHLQFVKPLIKFFENKGMEKNVCPIT